MLSLLTDRCKLSVRHVTCQLPAYAINATKDAPAKLKALSVVPFPNNPDGLSIGSNWGNGKFSVEATKADLANVINGISRLLGMPVADETGIQGNYSFTLRWTDGTQSPVGTTPDAAFDRTLAAALRDQLGLKLESTKAPVDTIVIDHIEEPTPN